jgi:hypothetical protein
VTYVFDTVLTYLKPKNVARLEQTCRRFAVNPERSRRLALSGPLWNYPSTVVCKSIRVYCNENLQDSTRALSELITSVLADMTPSSQVDLSEWLDQMAQKASIWSRNVIMPTVVDLGPVYVYNVRSMRPDFCNLKWMLRSEKVEMPAKKDILLFFITLSDFIGDDEYEDRDILRDFYRYDLDGEIMRLAVSHPSTDRNQLEELNEEIGYIACMLLNQEILSRGLRHREWVGQNSPIDALTMAMHSLYIQSFPYNWPCIPYYLYDEVSACREEEIQEFWRTEHPRVFRIWKNTFAEIFRWLRETEADKHDVEFILMNQCTLFANLFHAGCTDIVPINSFSFGVFVMKKCMEHGSTVALIKSLASERDYSKFIADYYTMTKLCSKAFRRTLEWKDLEEYQASYGFY